MSPLDLVKLPALMELASGSPEIVIGLIDGPVAIHHPDLEADNIRQVSGGQSATCSQASSAACMHGTFVAGILAAKRSSAAPAICPNCTLLVRPIFPESTPGSGQLTSTTPEELAAAIIETANAGARVINLSAALARPSSSGHYQLEEALAYATRRGAIAVAAAGNQGIVATSPITRHPGVIPIVACDLRGAPIGESNLGGSIGKRGLRAPGDAITSLGTQGQPITFGGTSAAAPFVSGAIALLWSVFPSASAAEIRSAVTQATAPRQGTVVPPLLDAWAAYQTLAATHNERR